MIVSFRYSLII